MRVLRLRNFQNGNHKKDLCGNSGNKYSHEFSRKYALPCLLVSSCFLCGYYPDPLRFKRFPFIPKSLNSSSSCPSSRVIWLSTAVSLLVLVRQFEPIMPKCKV